MLTKKAWGAIMGTWNLKLIGALVLVIGLIGLVSGAYLKGLSNGSRNERAIWVERTAEAQRVAVSEREASRKKADQLAQRVQEERKAAAAIRRKLEREIENQSRVRRALDERVVRLLNELASADQAGKAAAGAAPKDGSAASDRTGSGRGASSQSVAKALKEARGGYDSCRSQLNALIDWANSVSD